MCAAQKSFLQVVDEEATAKKKEEAVKAAQEKGEDADKVEVEAVQKSKSTTEWGLDAAKRQQAPLDAQPARGKRSDFPKTRTGF